jgi:hypothetical protein
MHTEFLWGNLLENGHLRKSHLENMDGDGITLQSILGRQDVGFSISGVEPSGSVT